MSETHEVAIASVRQPLRRRKFRMTLTDRQRDCLLLVSRGKNDRQIGEALGISCQTVHKHIETAKKRCGVSTRLELVLLAVFAGNLDLKEIMAGQQALARGR